MTISAGSTILADDLTKLIVNATHAGMTLAQGLNAITFTETLDEGARFSINSYFPPSGRAILYVLRILFPNADADGGSLTGSTMEVYNTTTSTILKTLTIDTALSQQYERVLTCIVRSGTSEEIRFRIENNSGGTRHTVSGNLDIVTL